MVSVALRLHHNMRTQTCIWQRREPETLQMIGQSTHQGYAVCPISSSSSLVLLSWWIFNCLSKHLGQDMCVRTDKEHRPPVAAACFWLSGGKGKGKNGWQLWHRAVRTAMLRNICRYWNLLLGVPSRARKLTRLLGCLAWDPGSHWFPNTINSRHLDETKTSGLYSGEILI